GGGAGRAARGRAGRAAHHAAGRAPGSGQAGRRGCLPRRRGLLGRHVAVEPGLEPAIARRGRAAGQPRDRERIRLRLRGPAAVAGGRAADRTGPRPGRRHLDPRAHPGREPFRLSSLLICYVRPMLHGRSAETARIDKMLAAARDGRSGALVIRGEAGVGKTALLDYASAAAGMRVLRGTGIESEAELPFAALQLLLRPGLGRLDVLPPPQARALRGAFGLAGTPGADRFLIGLAALSLLSELAGDAVLLCVVDDAHWLDRASADALQFAARRLGSEGVVLLASAREDGFEAPGLPELTLGRLGREASRALLDERAPGLPPGLADRVLAEADGNPLALLELPAALSESSGVPVALAASLELPAPLPLPRRLQQSYYRQAAALPAPTRAFLLVAAAEETGDLGLVRRAAQALGVPATAADAAERSGLIVVNAPAVAFRHPLVRAAVYQGATSAERGAAHAALAAALHDPMGGAPDADRHAWHQAAAAAGPDEGVAAALEQAADRARQRLGHAAAAAALERAARLT